MRHRFHPAIALVGWYLISPIGTPAKPKILPPNTPVFQWRNLRTFDSSDDCEKALIALRTFFEQATQNEMTIWRKQKNDSGVDRALQASAAQAAAERSVCIASDDPRLDKPLSERHGSSRRKNLGESANSQRSAELSPEVAPHQVPITPMGAALDAPKSRLQSSLPSPNSNRPIPGELVTRVVPAAPIMTSRKHPPATPVSATQQFPRRSPRVSDPALAATTNSAPAAALSSPVVSRTSRADQPSNPVGSQPQILSKASGIVALTKPVTVASVGNLTFWRLTTGGVIARSTDGANWRPLNSGTTTDLFAGAAPSAEICWVVGRSGTVLRTTDGEQWQAIASPTDADLVDVAATDEFSATVFADDGQQFTTDDGGLSWRASGNTPSRLGGTM